MNDIYNYLFIPRLVYVCIYMYVSIVGKEMYK